MAIDRIAFIHCRNYFNTGDMNACPFEYFKKFFIDRKLKIRFIDVSDFQFDSPPKVDDVDERCAIIVGGGGLYDYCNPWNKAIITAVEKSSISISWGAGYNFTPSRNEGIHVISDRVDEKKFTLYSTRDISGTSRFVPCPSCLHEAFRNVKKKPFTRGALFVAHYGCPESSDIYSEARKNGSRIMNNSDSVYSLLDAMSRVDCVVSNSYHMLMWATLLGVPSLRIGGKGSHDSRFDFSDLKYADYEDAVVDKHIPQAPVGKLEEYVDLNLKFSEEVKNLIG